MSSKLSKFCFSVPLSFLEHQQGSAITKQHMLTYSRCTNILQVLTMHWEDEDKAHWEDNVLMWIEQKSVPQSLKKTPKQRGTQAERHRFVSWNSPSNPQTSTSYIL